MKPRFLPRNCTAFRRTQDDLWTIRIVLWETGQDLTTPRPRIVADADSWRALGFPETSGGIFSPSTNPRYRHEIFLPGWLLFSPADRRRSKAKRRRAARGKILDKAIRNIDALAPDGPAPTWLAVRRALVRSSLLMRILLHEMAHAKAWPAGAGDAHGFYFRIACGTLGAPWGVSHPCGADAYGWPQDSHIGQPASVDAGAVAERAQTIAAAACRQAARVK